MKRIGFDAPSTPEPKITVVDELQVAINRLMPYILAQYKPDGKTANKEFITSRELLYELQEITTTNMEVINKTLEQLGFDLKFIDKVPCWVVYTTPEQENP